MLFQAITVPNGAAVSVWVDLPAAYAAANSSREDWSMALGAMIWPVGFNQASAKIEVADDGAGLNAGALYDMDGVTIMSNIVKPALGVRTTLLPSRFSMVRFVRIVLPANASQDWTFSVGMRRAT